jgi:hypothetical protein
LIHEFAEGPAATAITMVTATDIPKGGSRGRGPFLGKPRLIQSVPAGRQGGG